MEFDRQYSDERMVLGKINSVTLDAFSYVCILGYSISNLVGILGVLPMLFI